MLLFSIKKKDREFTENMNKENGRLIGFDESDKNIQIEMSNHCRLSYRFLYVAR